MARRGRKPTGAGLVERLEGSAHAKGRLKLVLETLSGQKTIAQACRELGIQESMFHKMRAQVLQTAVDRLEPRPAGRKPQILSPEARRVEELENVLAQVRLDLQATEIRRELAETLPRLHGLADEPCAVPAGKKTTPNRRATRRRRKKRRP